LEGRSLDLQEARDEASLALAREQMAHQTQLQTSELTQREAEFARGLDLSERQFTEQQNQFAQQFGEQVATRLQADEQFEATLEAEDARFAVESGLRERALDLQETGMDMDESFRRASLDQERELTEAAQALQEQGMELEDAYRWAALEQDGEFRAETNRLTEMGLNLEDAYRYAELDFQQRRLEQQEAQFLRELGFRRSLAENEQERFELMIDLWRQYFKLDEGEEPGEEDEEGENGEEGEDGTGAMDGSRRSRLRTVRRTAGMILCMRLRALVLHPPPSLRRPQVRRATER